MGRPVWIGVAILMDDGTTDTWQLNAADAPIQLRTEQGGVTGLSGPSWTWDLSNLLVPTKLYIEGKARRWGPQAGHGSDLRIPTQKEIGS